MRKFELNFFTKSLFSQVFRLKVFKNFVSQIFLKIFMSSVGSSIEFSAMAFRRTCTSDARSLFFIRSVGSSIEHQYISKGLFFGAQFVFNKFCTRVQHENISKLHLQFVLRMFCGSFSRVRHFDEPALLLEFVLHKFRFLFHQVKH